MPLLSPSSPGRERPADGRRARIASALAYVREPAHLRRTLLTALIVGVILTTINQAGVLLSGEAGAATYARCGLNFVVPFIVSNVGLLSGRPTVAALGEAFSDW